MRPQTQCVRMHDGVELNASTDPLRALPLESHQRRRCDACAFPLFDPLDCNVWRIGRPDGSVVHTYLCQHCDERWSKHQDVPAPARRMRRRGRQREVSH